MAPSSDTAGPNAVTLGLQPWPRARLDLAPPLVLGLTIVAGIVVLALLAVIVWLSFTEGAPGSPNFVYTTRHYVELVESGITYRVLYNTVVFSLVTLLVALSVGVPIAWLAERTDLPGKSVVFTFMTLALLFPGFSAALGWLFLMNPRIGILNHMAMSLFGLNNPPFDISSLGGMGIINGLTLTPIAFIMTSVVLRNLDPALEEAAHMSGASFWRTIWRVTLPLAWPGTLAAAIYIFAIGFASFDVPAILGLTNGIYTYSTYLYDAINSATGTPEYGAVAAPGLVMVLLAGLLTWWYLVAQRQAPKYAVVTGKAYRPSLVALGALRPVAFAFIVMFFVLDELLPLLTLVWGAGLPYLQPFSIAALSRFSLQNFRGLPLGLIGTGLRTTGELMVLVPTITVALSFAISWVVMRSKIRGRAVFDFLAFLPHTIPSIVFSVAALLLALYVLQDVLPIYGTIWILVLVYVVARMSYGTRMINSALIQLHADLEHSASICGANTGATMRSILLPLLAPALSYAWVWLALLSFRELTLPVLLASNDNTPLAVIVWGYANSSAYGQASAVAIIMVALMAPILFLYWMTAKKTGRLGTI